MKKYMLDLTVRENRALSSQYFLMVLATEDALPEINPGQFAEIEVKKSKVLLRRPISIHYVDYSKNEIWILVQKVGDGTIKLSEYQIGEKINVVFPLGNGFSLPLLSTDRVLLIGGGVGIAPLLYLGKCIKERGVEPKFLLGARSAKDLLEIERFEEVGEVYITTEDGTKGEKGFVTQHSLLREENFDKLYTCGPTPMMKAVAKYATEKNIACEVSLENKMACGVGACLCCVEDTKEGHKCVCSEGPVFNIKDLKW